MNDILAHCYGYRTTRSREVMTLLRAHCRRVPGSENFYDCASVEEVLLAQLESFLPSHTEQVALSRESCLALAIHLRRSFPSHHSKRGRKMLRRLSARSIARACESFPWPLYVPGDMVAETIMARYERVYGHAEYDGSYLLLRLVACLRDKDDGPASRHKGRAR